MSLLSNGSRGPVALWVVVLIINAPLALQGQNPKDRQHTSDKTTPIIGRVLADVESPVFGSGLGPLWLTFVFGVEQRGDGRLRPVKVEYAFFKSDGPLPDSFFSYSRRYELQVVRETKCDESFTSLAYTSNVDESGKALPSTNALRIMDGAPREVLKPNPVLPCYVLRPGKYKVLSTTGEQR